MGVGKRDNSVEDVGVEKHVCRERSVEAPRINRLQLPPAAKLILKLEGAYGQWSFEVLLFLLRGCSGGRRHRVVA